jgi:transposase
MDAKQLFTLALQLGPEWTVTKLELDPEKKELVIGMDFKRGTKFEAPGREHRLLCAVHDTVEKSWKHLNFFEYRTTIKARVPRVKTPEGEVVQIEVPWARPGSGFTLMMEALFMMLSEAMPMSEVAKMIGEHDTRIWPIFHHYVNTALTKEDWSKITRICVDETSAKTGHRYVTNVVDADTRRLIFMAEGRGAETLGAFVEALIAHGGKAEQIEVVSIDMSAAYKKGVAQSLPKAQVVFDRFHIMQLAGRAVDEVRKEIKRAGNEMDEGAMWALRGNQWNQSEDQKKVRRAVCDQYPKLGRALGLRESLQDLLKAGNEESLKWWRGWANRSRLESFRKLAATLKNHWSGVIAGFQNDISNGVMEAINGVIQLAKRQARGFRSFANFRAMALLKAGKLSLNLPSLLPT